MKKCIFLIIMFLFISIQTVGQTQWRDDIDFPQVPRVSAYEAFVKYKEGKAIILHGGGENYNRRHIIGALNFDVKPREHLINRLPTHGIEIITYCY